MKLIISMNTSTLKPTLSEYKNNDIAPHEVQSHLTLAKTLTLLGRVLYSSIFIFASFGHFTRGTIDYAAQQGVAYSEVLVPLSGILALLGGLSILLGYRAKIGALLLILFLVPVTLMMHNFWTVNDPAMHQLQMVMFMKNVSILGAALIIFHFGSGPLSIKN